jgi:two-component system, LuxR family, response regulator FixJ
MDHGLTLICKEAVMASETPGTRNLFIVDDDPMMRDALSIVFTLAGYRVIVFADAETFLAAARTRVPACVLLDLHLPDKSGVAVLKELDAHNYPAPVFIITGDRDVSSAVEAVKSGAFDYLVKPLDARPIVARVNGAIAAFSDRFENANDGSSPLIDFPGRRLLTPRECEVLAEIAGGASNKEAGRRLGISPRTVEVHRARIMDKIGARNAADLVRIVLSGSRGRFSSSPELAT